MPIELNGKDLTIEDIVKVARGREEVAIAPDAAERIDRCRAMLEKKVKNNEIMYLSLIHI